MIVLGQTRLSSFYEACFNILIGYAINFTANIVLIPYFLHTPPLDWRVNFVMGIPYTVISIVRQYAIRRWFQRRLHAVALKLAGVKT
jgi:hypothetical protein